MSPRCEVGRVPFFFLLHRPEDDALPVAMSTHPFTGEVMPMCTSCEGYLNDQAWDIYYESLPTWDEIYGL